MDCMLTNLTFPNNLKGAFSDYKRVLHCGGYDFEDFADEITEAVLLELFFTRRTKILSRPHGFIIYGKLVVDFFSISEFLNPNVKIGLRIIRPRPNLYMTRDNPNVSLGIVDCSFYTRRFFLKDDYHKERMNTPVDFNYLETLAKNFIIRVKQN